jgi:phosphoenolpyruvate carboxykinase (ATP)
VHQAGPVISKHGLGALGVSAPGNASFRLNNLGNVYWNLSVPALYEEALRRKEGVLAAGGPLCVLTGVHTGRSPNDKFFVREPGSESKIDWGKTNKPMEPAKFEGLLARMLAYAQRRDLFVRECYGGADPAHRIKVRVIN